MLPKRRCSEKKRKRSNEFSMIQRNQTQWTEKLSSAEICVSFKEEVLRQKRDERQADRVQEQVEEKNTTSQRQKAHSKQQKPENTNLTKSCNTNHKQRCKKPCGQDDSHGKQRISGVSKGENRKGMLGNTRGKRSRRRTQIFYPKKVHCIPRGKNTQSGQC